MFLFTGFGDEERYIGPFPGVQYGHAAPRTSSATRPASPSTNGAPKPPPPPGSEPSSRVARNQSSSGPTR